METVNFSINELNRSLLIERKNRVIFLCSEASKKEKFLFEFIQKNLDSTAEMIDEELKELSEEQVAIINDLFPGILKMCKDEWKGDENILTPVEIILDKDKRKPCSLCNTENKVIFYIKNKINNRKMNVGSTCIHEFSTISLREGKTKGQLLKEAAKIAYLRDLAINFPGITRQIEDWDKQIDFYEILIPKMLEEEYLLLGDEFKSLHALYLTGKGSEDTFEKFRDLLLKKEAINSTIKNYVDENRLNKWVATREVVSWLKRNGKQTVIELLKETGHVTNQTASEIEEENYLKLIKDEFNKILIRHDFVISKVDLDNMHFIINAKRHNVNLSCKCRNFLNYFGAGIFGESDNGILKPINIFRVSSMYEESDVLKVVVEINKVLTRANSDIKIHEENNQSQYDYYEKNELDLFDSRINKIIVVDLFEFIKFIKHFAFENEAQERLLTEVSRFVDTLPNYTKKYHPKELKDLRGI